MITHARLTALLTYSPETGIFTWRSKPSSKTLIGTVAGSHQEHGYLVIRIEKRLYRAHRLAWFYIHKEWPPYLVDHINGVRDDNRLVNLRLATPSQNVANSHISKNNHSGFKGIHKNGRRYAASITVNRQKHYLGTFATPDAAHAAYLTAAKKHFGHFARAQ